MKKFEAKFHSKGDAGYSIRRIVLRNSRKELVEELKSNGYVIESLHEMR